MRARNLKPAFFKNEELADLPFEGRLLFQGLWCMADREGRLEDRPRRIKAEVFPYDAVDVEALLEQLASQQLIIRYEVGGGRYISIPTFLKHQKPHRNEAASCIPECPDSYQGQKGFTPGSEALPTKDSITRAESPFSESPFSEYTYGAPTSGATPVETVETVENSSREPQQTDSKPDNRTPTQRLVAFYIDERTRLGSKPTIRQRGIVADIIGQKMRGGSAPENVREAIARMVSRGRPPSTLPAFIDEVEAERKRTPVHPSHVPFVPLPELTPEERIEAEAAAREAAERIRALAAGIGAPAP